MSYTLEALGCTLPPADFKGHPLPFITLGIALTPLWRIHRAHLGPLAAGTAPHRLDTAVVSSTFSTPRRRSAVSPRLVAPDGRPLALTDLTAPPLPLGMDGRGPTVTDYLGPNL